MSYKKVIPSVFVAKFPREPFYIVFNAFHPVTSRNVRFVVYAISGKRLFFSFIPFGEDLPTKGSRVTVYSALFDDDVFFYDIFGYCFSPSPSDLEKLRDNYEFLREVYNELY